MTQSFLLSKLGLFFTAAIVATIARWSSCNFSVFSLTQLNGLSGEGLVVLFSENQPRTLQDKHFNTLYRFLEWIYAIFKLSSRDRTLKTKYHKVFKSALFQPTKIPTRD